MKKRFKIVVRLNGVEQELIKDAGIGVVASKQYEFDIHESLYSTPDFFKKIADHGDELIKETVSCHVVEIPLENENDDKN